MNLSMNQTMLLHQFNSVFSVIVTRTTIAHFRPTYSVAFHEEVQEVKILASLYVNKFTSGICPLRVNLGLKGFKGLTDYMQIKLRL